MRTLVRLAIAATLIASCQSIIAPEPIVCTPGEEQLRIEPDSVRLVFGTIGEVRAFMWDDCGGEVPIVAENAGRLVRDSTVASLGDTLDLDRLGYPDRLAIMLPEAPGRTHLVLDIGGELDSVPILVPDTVEIASLAGLESGRDASCAISGDGTAMCWGYGGFILGSPFDDEAVGQCWGAPCSPMPVPRMADALEVWVGATHACALDTSGEPWCWGGNESNQVDAGGSGHYPDPVPVTPGASLTELRLGQRHTCGLTTDRDIICWGHNEAGQLGNGSAGSPATPTFVGGNHRWVALAATGDTSCGVTDQSSLLCWGYLGEENVSVPLSEECTITTVSGKGAPSERIVRCSTTPLPVPLAAEFGDDTLFVEVSATCARTSLGNIGCYDRGAGEVRSVPSSAMFVSLAASPRRACALTSSGEAWCWGDGPLGDGREAGSSIPVAVVGGHIFTDIGTGDFNSCGLTTDGDVWCWGYNELGQSGASILERPLVPTRIRGQS